MSDAATKMASSATRRGVVQHRRRRWERPRPKGRESGELQSTTTKPYSALDARPNAPTEAPLLALSFSLFSLSLSRAHKIFVPRPMSVGNGVWISLSLCASAHMRARKKEKTRRERVIPDHTYTLTPSLSACVYVLISSKKIKKDNVLLLIEPNALPSKTARRR